MAGCKREVLGRQTGKLFVKKQTKARGSCTRLGWNGMHRQDQREKRNEWLSQF